MLIGRYDQDYLFLFSYSKEKKRQIKVNTMIFHILKN